MLNYRSDTNFYTDARQFIIGSEGFENGTIYPDSVSIPTIGYGYAMLIKNKDGAYEVNSNIVDDFPNINLALTESQGNLLKEIAKKLNVNDTAGARSLIATLDVGVRDLTTTEADTLFQLSFDRALTQVEHQFKALLGAANGHQLFTSLAGSTEMIAIASLGYNSPGLIGKNLTTALWNGDRAEAWYEIRYGSNSGASKGQGIANRRYRESDTFGLYDDAAIPSLDDAKQAYRMFTLHREDILKYENTYSPTNINAKSSLISDQLSTATVTLLADLAYNTNPDIANAYAAWEAAGNSAASFLSTNLYLDPGRNSASQQLDPNHVVWLDARQYDKITGAENASNDILIGEGGDDTLMGGKGADLLIGGAGDDMLYGGGGKDIMAGGKGDDTYIVTGDGSILEDKQGFDRVFFNGKYLSSLITQADGSIKSYDDLFTAAWKGTDLEVTDVATGDKVTLNKNFQSGDFGIILSDAPVPTQATNTVIGATDNADWLIGNTGNDIIEGLGGNDVLAGFEGDDYLYSDTQITTQQAIINGNTDAGTGLKGEWLMGMAGNDTLVGGTGNDVLLGGGGQDLLIAGAGDDEILGDTEYGPLNFNWTVIDVPPNNRSFGQAIGGQMPSDAAADIIYAGDGLDHVWGGAGNDVIYGEGGNDSLYGNDGNDIVMGGAGDDTITGDGAAVAGQTVVNEGNDYIDGGDGNDHAWGNGGNDTLMGGSGDDTLSGDNGDGSGVEGNDYLNGGDGNDKLWGDGGDDILFGGTGDDILTGDSGNGTSPEGNDYLDGGDGNDILYGEGGDDILAGGAGQDSLYGGTGANYLDGGDGNDTLSSLGADSTLFGGKGDDSINSGGANSYLDGEEGNNSLYAEGGNNTLLAGSGNDSLQATGGHNYLDAGDGTNSLIVDGGGYNTLFAGAGDDYLSAKDGNNHLDGGEGANTLVAEGGHNTLTSGSGSDLLSAAGGNNTLDAGAGDDRLVADGGNNTLFGGAGDDYLSSAGGGSTLDGGDGNDTLIADMDNNTLQGGAGGDILIARGGNNTLDGGEGRDWYVLDAGFGSSHIADSGTGGNGIQFNFNFGGSGITLGLGSLKLSFANGDELHIDNFNPNDPLNSSSIDGTANINGTGNAQNNNLLGNDADNTLSGLAGNDTLAGGAADEQLFGGGDNFLLADRRTRRKCEILQSSRWSNSFRFQSHWGYVAALNRNCAAKKYNCYRKNMDIETVTRQNCA